MAKVIMENWREGIKIISLTKLQYEMLGLSLSESKRNADLLLDDQIIILEIEDENVAREFFEEANKLGADCRFLS